MLDVFYPLYLLSISNKLPKSRILKDRLEIKLQTDMAKST